MTENKKWITPFLKQLLVVCGVSLNMANMGGVMGFPAVLLPQLRSPDSEIPIDNSAGSWIASIIGISLFVGNLMVPTLMGKFGRKIASLISCSILLVCWLWIALASDVTSLLIARFFQGLALGINLSLSPIMIGELTSPINRGVFTTIMSSMITADTLLVHVLGSYLTWQTTALVCAFVSCASLSILIFLPESPSWLADKGRYEDSAKAFKWLRGESEDEELEKMLEARKTRDAIIIGKTYEEDNRSCFDFVVKTLKKREFRKPVFIMIHLYTLSLWTGMPFLIVYTVDMLNLIVGPGIDVALHVTLLDLQRMISTIIGLIVVKKIKRRTILFSTVGVNLAALVALIIYMFVKTWCHLPFDHPAIGLILIHIHMCSVTTGVLPLPLVISGELFPLEFRSLAGGISGIAFSFNYFVTSKTAGFLQNNIGMYGTYLLYLFVAIYCSLVVWIHLPETKDRTLQDIEDEFKGKSKKDEVESAVTLPLKSEKGFDEES